MLKGIWTNNLSYANIAILRKQGFDSLFFKCGYFYDTYSLPTDTVEEKQKYAVEAMKNTYDYAKGIGYKLFLIDVGWGLGIADNNFFWQKIKSKFINCSDTLFYHGEPIEGMVETKQFTFEQAMNIMLEKSKWCGRKTFVTDATARNIEEVENWNNFYFDEQVIPSYYFNQHKKWQIGIPFVWIYGQLKIGGSLRYKFLIKTANNEFNTQTAFLYQGDYPEWTFTCFLIKLLALIKKKEWFENWMRDRFIKSTEKKVIGEPGKIGVATI